MSEITDEEFLSELESEDKRSIPNDKLQQVSAIAEDLAHTAAQIAQIEMILERKKADLDRLQYHDLPDAMDSIGMESFRLKDGTKIEVKPVLKVSCLEDKIDDIDDYFQRTGNTGLMKRTIAAIVPRGEPEQNYAKIKAAIAEAGYESEDKKGVHWQTLNKWAREWVELGESVPEDLFSVFQGRQAKIAKGK